MAECAFPPLSLLAYHTKPSPEAAAKFASTPVPKLGDFPGFELFQWDTQSFPIEQSPLLVLLMFHELGLVEEFRIPHQPLCHFILCVIEGYRSVPYHNWRHAFSVAHSLFAIAKAVNLRNYLPAHEILAFFVAALCHDIDHRGRNNAFQVIKGDPLSKVYSTSYLEFHHFNYSLVLLNAENNNILQNVPQETFEAIVQHMKFVVLATDLANHFKTRGEFKKEFIEDKVPYNRENTNHRELLCEAIMTCCDISSAAMLFEVSASITKTVYEEFFQQGDEEKVLGSVPNASMDRQSANIPKHQLNFIDFIAKMAFSNLCSFFPQLQFLVDTVLENRKVWESRLNSEQDDAHNGPVFLPTH